MEFLASFKSLICIRNRPATFISLLCASLFVGAIISLGGVSVGILTLLLVIAVPAIYAIVTYPLFGIVILIIFSFFIALISRLGITFPLGTLLDGLQWLLLLGLIIRLKYFSEAGIYRNEITVFILIWICYNFLELANPVAESRLAWLYTIRTVATIMLMYFVFVHYLRNIKVIKIILKLWLLLSFIAAMYALKQEYLGFFDFETQWLASDPRFNSLYFIAGHWRKVSIFADPVTFSYNMAISSILSFCLLFAPIVSYKKYLLALSGFLFLFAMIFSGTRGAYILVPAAFVLVAIMKFNKKILLIGVVFGMLLALLIYTPTSNVNVQRLQSTFWPSQDASFNLRENNQKKIQPYIRSHPFGGGLGATGAWGQRFAPNSYLANFPPDSGYVRVAVEQGWVGLLLLCALIFVVLKTGIINYYRMNDPFLKHCCLAMTMIVFVMNIGNFPQEALVQYPNNIIFYLAIALIHTTFLVDRRI